LKPSIITLLTDFGSQDYFVAAMKGTILSIDPNAVIADITHEIPAHDIHAGAFNLLAVYKDFPAGTVHAAVVDPGVGSSRRGIAVECAGQFFVGPDNGLFSWICERERDFHAVHLTNTKFFRPSVSQTFHGRDVFAPVAAWLTKETPLAEFGPVINDLVQLDSLAAKTLADGSTEGRILHIDRFGNCITNLTRDHLAAGEIAGEARLRVNGREITSFREFFADEMVEGELFCLFGSAGFLEIATLNSSAAKTIGAQCGNPIMLLGARPAEPF
jgi:S-adenosyl-L-methionine hydrolase (adenosine-forming)